MTAKNEQDGETGGAPAPAGNETPKPVDRRTFLRGSVAAAGALLAYSTPRIQAAGRTRNISGPPYNCDEVPTVTSTMEAFSFSTEAQANIATIGPIGQAACQGQTLTDEQLDSLWNLGWLPAAEVNDNETAREVINSLLICPSGPWKIEPGNQGDYIQPDYDVSRARLEGFYGSCENVECFGWAAVAIIALIIVACTPETAY
jgi:hypothetical protein